eukprot:363224-Chlamydomonas_euryale.AAC.5
MTLAAAQRLSCSSGSGSGSGSVGARHPRRPNHAATTTIPPPSRSRHVSSSAVTAASGRIPESQSPRRHMRGASAVVAAAAASVSAAASGCYGRRCVATSAGLKWFGGSSESRGSSAAATNTPLAWCAVPCILGYWGYDTHAEATTT